MTGYELLWLYARLRGIPEGQIREAVDTEIKRLDLLKHAKNVCGTYRWGLHTKNHILFCIVLQTLNHRTVELPI